MNLYFFHPKSLLTFKNVKRISAFLYLFTFVIMIVGLSLLSIPVDWGKGQAYCNYWMYTFPGTVNDFLQSPITSPIVKVGLVFSIVLTPIIFGLTTIYFFIGLYLFKKL